MTVGGGLRISSCSEGKFWKNASYYNEFWKQ